MPANVTKKFHRYTVMVTDLYLDELNQPRADERVVEELTAREVSDADIAKRYPGAARVQVVSREQVKATMPVEQFLAVAAIEVVEDDE